MYILVEGFSVRYLLNSSPNRTHVTLQHKLLIANIDNIFSDEHFQIFWHRVEDQVSGLRGLQLWQDGQVCWQSRKKSNILPIDLIANCYWPVFLMFYLVLFVLFIVHNLIQRPLMHCNGPPLGNFTNFTFTGIVFRLSNINPHKYHHNLCSQSPFCKF